MALFEEADIQFHTETDFRKKASKGVAPEATTAFFLDVKFSDLD